MNDRKVFRTLIPLVIEEIIFYDKGYGNDKPDAVLRKYQELQDAREWLESKVNALNVKDYDYESG